jgi:hypothetical protein
MPHLRELLPPTEPLAEPSPSFAYTTSITGMAAAAAAVDKRPSTQNHKWLPMVFFYIFVVM